MKKTLYTVQGLHAGILAAALEKHRAALDASSTGTGKTVVGATLAALYRRPTLVVGLKDTLGVWREEMKEQGWPCIGAINYEMLRTGKTPWGEWQGIKDQKLWKWTIPANTQIIWDEVQKCQGFRSLNSKMLIAAKPFYNLMLSATAVESPSEMRALGYILGLHSLGNFWKWAKEHGCSPNPWGGLDFNNDLAILAQLHGQIFPEHGSRMTVDMLHEHFTETQIITTPLDFGDEIAQIYEQMEAEIANLADIMSSDSHHPAAAMLVAQLRARQKVEFLKVPVILERVTNLLHEGRSVVVFVNFNETINALTKRHPKAVIIRGGQSMTERAAAKVAFMNNTAKLLICNTQAGGVSIDLHDIHGGHPRTSIISPDWNAKSVLQALGRVHRAGGKSPTQQHVLFAAGTVEEVVERVVRQKIKNITLFNDGPEETPEVAPEAPPVVIDDMEGVTESDIKTR